nr:hypothetical protein [Roseovarius sp. SCSIO 43702]
MREIDDLGLVVLRQPIPEQEAILTLPAGENIATARHEKIVAPSTVQVVAFCVLLFVTWAAYRIVAPTAEKHILAGSAVKAVVAEPTVQRIVSVIPGKRVVCRPAVQCVISRSTTEAVVAAMTQNHIATGSAIGVIVASPALQGVVTTTPGQRIRAIATPEAIGTRAPGEGVIAAIPVHDIAQVAAGVPVICLRSGDDPLLVSGIGPGADSRPGYGGLLRYCRPIAGRRIGPRREIQNGSGSSFRGLIRGADIWSALDALGRILVLIMRHAENRSRADCHRTQETRKHEHRCTIRSDPRISGHIEHALSIPIWLTG